MFVRYSRFAIVKRKTVKSKAVSRSGAVFAYMYVMPKRPRDMHAVRIVRLATGMSQPRFGKLVGISGALVQAIENGQRPLTRDVADRIGLTTGAEPKQLLAGFALDMKLQPYTDASFRDWRTNYLKPEQWKGEFDFEQLSPQLKDMFEAAAREGSQQLSLLFLSLRKWMEEHKTKLNLQPHIDGVRRDRRAATRRPPRGN
jgi:transcriptional regulator with XRE-family HTH domain